MHEETEDDKGHGGELELGMKISPGKNFRT